MAFFDKLKNQDASAVTDAVRQTAANIGTKTEIQKLVLKLAEEGKSVLFISSEIEEMLRTCNRMAVLRDGAKVGEISGEMTQESVMAAIAGGAENE